MSDDCQTWSIRLLSPAIVLASGLALCSAQFGTMFWGNWLHSASFSIGLLIVLLAIGIFCGALVDSRKVGVTAFGVLFVLYLFFFWTFIGWLLLFKLIHWAFIPGSMPAGM
jgi:hypothetical protein